MKSKIRFIIPLALLAILFVIGLILLFTYLNSVELAVNAKNISSYKIEKDDFSVFNSSSGDSEDIRVPKYSSITISYKGKGIYADGTQQIDIGDKNSSTSINPYYSKKYLSSLIDANKSAIKEAITSYNEDINNLYTINSYMLYHFGDWASATLAWKGEYSSNSDNLKVILKKNNETWEVAGDPSLLFFNKNYSTIPVDILEAVNKS